MNAKAIAFTDVGQVSLLDCTVPEPDGAGLDEGELLVRVEFTVVSPGTELRCLAGLQPNALPYPYIPGYGVVGTVEAVGSGVPFALGTRVLSSGTKRCSLTSQWGAHVSMAVVRMGDTLVIPEGCSSLDAAFSRLAAIALRGVHVTQPEPKERVVVVGLGPIGMLSARLFRAHGADVLAVDMRATRVELAQASGLASAVVAGNLAQLVEHHFGVLADTVVDATVTPAALEASLSALRHVAWGDSAELGAKLVIQGSYPASFSLPYQEAFARELRLYLPRDLRPAELREALAMIADGRCRVSDLASRVASPADCSVMYEYLKSDGSAMTVAFDWARLGS